MDVNLKAYFFCRRKRPRGRCATKAPGSTVNTVSAATMAICMQPQSLQRK